MVETIAVSEASDNDDLSISSTTLRHVDCVSSGLVRNHRNLATGSCVLRCACGLEIQISESQITDILKTSIDGATRQLDLIPVHSSSTSSIRIVRPD